MAGRKQTLGIWRLLYAPATRQVGCIATEIVRAQTYAFAFSESLAIEATIGAPEMYDFEGLSAQQFELLCAALLAAEGFTEIRSFAKAGEPDRGIDLVASSPTGDRWIVQVKRSIRRISRSDLRRVITDLENGLVLTGARRALVICADVIPDRVRADLQLPVGFQLWDRQVVEQLLQKNEHVRQAFAAVVMSADVLQHLAQTMGFEPKSATHELRVRLRAVPRGRDGWREFEDVCIDILNYVFVPPLRVPKIQSRTEDGLDRRDAVYPIGRGGPFWDSLKHQYSTRMIVVEFKNHTEPVGQRDVESLQQYLLPKAKRSFGIICSRTSPSESALKARRRAWMTAENIILFLADDDLEKLLALREGGEDPSHVLDELMDDFYITLAP